MCGGIRERFEGGGYGGNGGARHVGPAAVHEGVLCGEVGGWHTGPCGDGLGVFFLVTGFPPIHKRKNLN